MADLQGGTCGFRIICCKGILRRLVNHNIADFAEKLQQ
jgi:hypothetical protein